MKPEQIQAVNKVADEIVVAHLKLKFLCPQRQGNYWFNPYKVLNLQRLKKPLLAQLIDYLDKHLGLSARFNSLTQMIHVTVDESKVVMNVEQCQLYARLRSA